MYSRNRPKYGILDLLAQEAVVRAIEPSGALATVSAHRRARGRPCKWRKIYAPIADGYLDQLARNRDALTRCGCRATNVAAFELMLNRTRPDLAEFRRRKIAKALARRVPDFHKYSERYQ